MRSYMYKELAAAPTLVIGYVTQYLGRELLVGDVLLTQRRGPLLLWLSCSHSLDSLQGHPFGCRRYRHEVQACHPRVGQQAGEHIRVVLPAVLCQGGFGWSAIDGR